MAHAGPAPPEAPHAVLPLHCLTGNTWRGDHQGRGPALSTQEKAKLQGPGWGLGWPSREGGMKCLSLKVTGCLSEIQT